MTTPALERIRAATCPSCGDQLSHAGPNLCAACQEACEQYPESAPTMKATLPTVYRREIVYDREVREYACYLNGELVCFAHNYREAEITLDQLVFELLFFREAS